MTQTFTRIPDGVQLLEGSTRGPDRVRLAGASCLFGGLVWLGTLLATAAFGGDEAVAQHRPLFLAVEAGFLLADVLILVGLVGLGWSGATRRWLGRVGLGLALVGRAIFIAAELADIAQGGGADLLPVAAIVSALGMLLVGIAVLVERRGGGWQRFTPLLVGVYPLVAMFPLAIVDRPNVVAMALWGVCWALLGLAMRTSPRFLDVVTP